MKEREGGIEGVGEGDREGEREIGREQEREKASNIKREVEKCIFSPDCTAEYETSMTKKNTLG